MTRDYKHRVHINKPTSNQYRQHAHANAKIDSMKWMQISALFISSAVFLVYLGTIKGESKPVYLPVKVATIIENAQKSEPVNDLQHPKFDFYDLLTRK